MSNNDIAIVPVSSFANPQLSKKPNYLIVIEGATPKGPKTTRKFITLDKPEYLNGFVQARGCYSEESEEEIVKSFQDLLTGQPKEAILELLFPWHKILFIRSLVFKQK